MKNLADLHNRLEFDKILSHLKRLAISETAREQLTNVEFMTDTDKVVAALQEVSELRALLDFDDPFPLTEIPEIRADLEIAGVDGAFLRPEGLSRVARLLETSRRVRSYLGTRREKCGLLWKRAHSIVSLKNIENAISDKIDRQTAEMLDSASTKLSQIRKAIARAEQKARKTMDQLCKSYSAKGYLQEAVVTLRGGRRVLPARLEHRGDVKGLVHDYSASGSTLFIEPFQVVEINNEMQRLRGEEVQEIERVLRELTWLIRENLEPIIGNLRIVTTLDIIQARARFARQLNCSEPEISNDASLHITNGRHPLLLLREESHESVVPLNLELTGDVKTLVVTGPNAGGKTVALKTVGLLSLMVQSGIPIPADADSSIPIYDEIFVDIGDFQSIEQDLSTFTSHLAQVQDILEKAGAKSLVLVDEIGVGTDPDEGSALAVAFLEELTRRGGHTIVTTHHGALKEFAYSASGVENGSMEFEAETLRPTYRLRLGIPGSSYAIEIAKRLGLSGRVLERARELIGTEKGRLEQLILDLEKKVQESERLANELKLENTRLKGLSNLYNERSEAIKKEEKALKQKALVEAQDILARANTAVEQAIKTIREKEASRDSINQAKELISDQKAKITSAVKENSQEAPTSDEVPLADVAVGRRVYWPKQKAHGQIVSDIEGSGKVMIQVDNLKFRVPLAELRESKKPAASNKTTRPVRVQTTPKSDLLPEIDVRGQKLDEAIANVDKFLDDALLASWHQVRLIHGKGTGILRKGIDEFLAKHARVKSRKMAAWNEGDIGVTVVELD